MGAWLSNISLKYKFWAVNAVAFVTTLLLVLYAVQLEQQARSHASQCLGASPGAIAQSLAGRTGIAKNRSGADLQTRRSTAPE
jgi:hypothetical protein